MAGRHIHSTQGRHWQNSNWLQILVMLFLVTALQACSNSSSDSSENGKTNPPPPNSAPVALDDAATIQQGEIATIDVLANDSDAEDTVIDSATLMVMEIPTTGTTVIEGGNIIFTPLPDFYGTVDIPYEIADSLGLTASAVVHINVNAPPLTTDDHWTTTVNQPITFDPLTNDSDPENRLDQGSLALLNVPATVSAQVNTDHSVTVTPATKFMGDITFEYSVEDYDGGKSTGTITIAVTAKTIHLSAESSVNVAFRKDGTVFYSRGGGGGGGRGFSVAVISMITGELLDTPRTYDTYGLGASAGNQLAQYINEKIPVGAIVMIAVGDSAGSYGSNLISALANLGATQASNIGWRQTYALLSVKGGDVLSEVRGTATWQWVSAAADVTLAVEDPHGDTPESATPLLLNNGVYGYLYSQELDTFRLELPHAGVITLKNTHVDTTSMALKTSDGIELTSSALFQDFADPSIKIYLPAGTYYLDVTGLLNTEIAGTFVITNHYVIDPPLPEDLTFGAHSNSGAQFSVNGSYIYNRGGGSGGGRGLNIAVVNPATGEILVAGLNFDTWATGATAGNALSDYINSLPDGQLLLLAVGDSLGAPGTQLVTTLENLGATLFSGIQWRETWAFATIKGTGVALDEVKGASQWTAVTATHMITVPGHDKDGSTPTTATSVTLNSITPSYLQMNDMDLFKISLGTEQSLSIYSEGDIDTVARVYTIDAANNVVEITADDNSGINNNFRIDTVLSPGDYYVEIVGGTINTVGNYSLIVSNNN